MVIKDRLEELRQRALAFGIISVYGINDSDIILVDKEQYKKKKKRPWKSIVTSLVNPGGASEEEIKQLMGSYYEEVADMRQSMGNVKDNILIISKGRDDMARVTSQEKEIIVRRRVEELISANNNIMTLLRKRIEEMKRQNDEFIEVAPTAVADWRTRDNIYKGICAQFRALVIDYQDIQARFAYDVKRRAFNNLHLALPEATMDEINELVECGVQPSEALKRRMVMKDDVTMGKEEAHVSMIRRLQDMQDKYSDLKRLEEAVTDLHQMFVEMAILVHQQGELLDNVEYNVVNAKHYTAEAEKSLIRAKKHQRSAQKTRIMGNQQVAALHPDDDEEDTRDTTELDAQGLKYDDTKNDTEDDVNSNDSNRLEEGVRSDTLPLPTLEDFNKMSEPVSVVFYQHGLWGHPYDLHNMAYGIYKRSGALPIMIKSNVGKTGDGVVAGGLRLLAECIPYFDSLPHGSKVSFLGHSLGGLYIRVALRNLFEKYPDYFLARGLILDRLILLACPNLGIRDVPAHIRAGAALGALAQQSMVDFLDSKGKLLQQLCDFSGIESIRPFRERLVYGNIQADLLVSADSALIVPPGCKLWLDETYDVTCQEVVEDTTTDDNNNEKKASIYPAYVEATDKLDPLAPAVALNSLTWRRYAVKFPMWSWAAMFDGSAHFKLVNHTTQDIHNCGVPVVNHISRHWKQLLVNNELNHPTTATAAAASSNTTSPSSTSSSSSSSDEVEREIRERHHNEPYQSYCTCLNKEEEDGELTGELEVENGSSNSSKHDLPARFNGKCDDDDDEVAFGSVLVTVPVSVDGDDGDDDDKLTHNNMEKRSNFPINVNDDSPSIATEGVSDSIIHLDHS
ncbi:Syntaxin-1A [Perkinsus chesapeaki]|uniref:Syntaxin-1A n=2 Tax=Alveolata TaxID=33630 RepID=A0A7J6M2C8_PERCH|nr:Syntaxin-1A [Perkinsus chesapeaki]